MDKSATTSLLAPGLAEPRVVLAREAGLPFDATAHRAEGSDPFVEWLSLMEVVVLLCPTWPVRDHAMQGTNWRL